MAAAAFYGVGHPVLFCFSIASGVISFWSWGVMHNFATESAKKRRELTVENMRLERRFEEDITRFDSRLVTPGAIDVEAVPNWVATINMLVTFVGFVLLICGALVRFL